VARLGRWLAAALLLGVTSCAAPHDGADEAPPGPVPTAEFGTPERLLVPSTVPPGFFVSQVLRGPGPGERRLVDGVATLYGDPEAADPLSGPTLSAFWQAGSDAGSGAPGRRSEGFRPITVQGHDGAIGTVGDDVWVTWMPPDEDQEQDSYAVVGRGLPEEQVLDAAAAAVIDHESAGIRPAGLPDGLAPLATGTVTFAFPVLSPTTWVRYERPGGGWVTVVVAEGGREVGLLARATVRGEQRQVRGVPASVGEQALSPEEEQSVRYAWAEDGLVAVVDGDGVPADVVADFVESLEAMPAAEALSRVERALGDAPPEALIGPGELLVLSGRFETGSWALGAKGRGADMTLSLNGVSAGAPIGGGFGNWPEGKTGAGSFVGPGYVMVYGALPEAVARAEIRLPDGSVVPAVSGRAAGYHMTFFGQYVPVAQTPASYLVVGYDGSGRRLVEHQVSL
jgi:hypothetical protein